MRLDAVQRKADLARLLDTLDKLSKKIVQMQETQGMCQCTAARIAVAGYGSGFQCIVLYFVYGILIGFLSFSCICFKRES